jgi:C1A family cysteine protease
MIKLLLPLALFVLIGCTSKMTNNDILSAMEGSSNKELFKAYHFLFKKDYDLNSELGLKRYKAFKQSLKIIKETNAKNLSYKYGFTKFTDMTDEEFEKTHLSDPKYFEDEKKRFLADSTKIDFDTMADELDSHPVRGTVDYSSQMNTVRDQGSCGDCWAHAGTGAVEHLLYRSGKKSSLIAVQHVTDCATNGVNAKGGCNGGAGMAVFLFSKKTGIFYEEDYPWTSGALGEAGTCQDDGTGNQTRVFVKGYNTCKTDACPISSYLSMLDGGAMVVSMYATKLKYYTSGVWDPETCGSSNHAVVAVGYRYDENNNLILKIRNSWGDDFGLAGYFEIYYKESTLTCGLTEHAWIPYF